MRRSGRRRGVCGIAPLPSHPAPLSKGGDLLVDVDSCRASCDPHEVKLSRGFHSQLRDKLIPQIGIAFFNCLSHCKRPVAIRATYSPSDLISRFPSCTCIANDCRQQLRTVVSLLAPKQSDRAIFVITDTEEESTARPFESCILFADGCSIRPRCNAIIFGGLTFQLCVCYRVFWQSVANDEQWLRTCLSVGPGNCLGVLKEDTTPRGARWTCWSILIAWCFFFHEEEPPIAGTAKACGLRLPVLHHKGGTSVSRLCDSQTDIFASTRNHREAH